MIVKSVALGCWIGLEWMDWLDTGLDSFPFLAVSSTLSFLLLLLLLLFYSGLRLAMYLYQF
jgi:hypothetical protein